MCVYMMCEHKCVWAQAHKCHLVYVEVRGQPWVLILILLCLRQGLRFVDVVALYKQQATWPSTFWGCSPVSSFLRHCRSIGTADVWSCPALYEFWEINLRSHDCTANALPPRPLPWSQGIAYSPALFDGHFDPAFSFHRTVIIEKKTTNLGKGGIWGVQRNKRGVCRDGVDMVLIQEVLKT